MTIPVEEYRPRRPTLALTTLRKAAHLGPRLVDKHSGEVAKLTVPDALARAERMAIVRS